MAKYAFDPKKDPPSSGSRQDYITPGQHPVKIVKYSDAPSNAGNPMHSFTFEVVKGDQKGKKISDWFVMPKKRTDSRVPLARLNQLIVAAAQVKTARTIDLAKLSGKTLIIDVGDVRQEAQKGADGREYPARTVSRIAEYIDPRKASAPDDDDEEDEEEDEDEEDEDEEDEEDEDEEAEDEDEDEDEEEEPAPRRGRGRPRTTAAAATAVAARPRGRPAKAAAAKPAAKKTTAKRKAAVEEEDDVDDDEDD